ncbi:hypothetical protein IVA95_22420 [Bradyrhizobium sp. 157]|jgi:hypothetical protein|uniref:hypothetical protein n=1 Tax=Bradyrhizobium sp. 157 TaxID=2782631 RepID=UPI001FFC1F05|nr:hypothetical protein [Bradyrhizobium sp. 157]MCK1640286.1 hypothetical protein [Bradyrhizobium sp. 157]
MNDDPHPEERRLRRVSKDAGPIVASWFETAQERLLTMRFGWIYADTPQKEGPQKRAFENGSCQLDRDQAVLE